MLLFYVLSFFKKGDTIQGGTLFKEIRYLEKRRFINLFLKKSYFKKYFNPIVAPTGLLCNKHFGKWGAMMTRYNARTTNPSKFLEPKFDINPDHQNKISKQIIKINYQNKLSNKNYQYKLSKQNIKTKYCKRIIKTRLSKFMNKTNCPY